MRCCQWQIVICSCQIELLAVHQWVEHPSLAFRSGRSEDRTSGHKTKRSHWELNPVPFDLAVASFCGGLREQVSSSEGICHRSRNFRFGQHQLNSVLRDLRLVFLFCGDRLGSSLLCLGSSHASICLGLVCLKPRTDIIADIDISDIDRDNFKSGLGIESSVENSSADSVRIFQDFRVSA